MMNSRILIFTLEKTKDFNLFYSYEILFPFTINFKCLFYYKMSINIKDNNF